MKKIAVNTMKTFLKEHKREDAHTEKFTVEDNSFEVTFHTALTVAEKSAFINRVLSGCFDTLGNFRPEYFSPMMRATILQMCTNVPAMTLKNESDEDGARTLDLDAMYELYQALDLDRLDCTDYQAMVMEMEDLCSEAIDWKKSRMLSECGVDTALRNLLDTLTAKVESTNVDSLMRYASTLSEATKGMEEGELVSKIIELSKYRNKTDL